MTEKSSAIIIDLPQSEVLKRNVLTGKDYNEVEITDLERKKLGKIVEVLDHPGLQRLIEEGQITFAMIKPRADLNLMGLDDLTAAEEVKMAVRKPLDVVFDISILFSEEEVNEFYAGEPKDLQIAQPPILHKDSFSSRWEEYVDLMTSGPTTVLLLYSPEGNAVAEWRRQIGHWNVDERREPGTIRGDFAKSNYANIVHGSDSTEAVQREIGFLSKHLKEILGKE